MARARGITIVELLVVSVILMLFFYMVYLLLAPGLRVWRKSDIKVTLQQNTLVGMRMMMNELRESNVNTVTIQKYEPSIHGISTLVCFASPRDFSGTLQGKWVDEGGFHYDSGFLVWSKFIIYYHDTERRLRRYDRIDFDSNKESGGMHIAGDPVAYIHVGDLQTDRVIARNIENFEVKYNPPPPDWKRYIDLKLEARDRLNSDMEDYVTGLQTTVEVRYNETQD